ncbi:hypothetical protein [Hymenobacter convexus]|uniref:hypothetical protein n=1 Tax=Hymenobacter sp. CA1UV-4 TaxID=3063782 RepID=UPI0027126126|nr:hypothetical protein [Hymenobacter sp. CA1UV-4]MDO7851201.1 hypothetical protein [Hymenobacter sp. CA1UV-4]
MKNISIPNIGQWLVGLFLLMGLLPAARAQAPAWQTAVVTDQVGMPHFSEVSASTTDASGNVYLVGLYAGTTSFGATTLTGTGSFPNIFVAKWSAASQGFLWAVKAGGDGFYGNYVNSIAVSGTNVYISGIVSGSATFGSFLLSGTNYTTTSFIAKLSDAGTSASFGWVQPGVGASALATSGTSVYVAGSFAQTLTLGSTVLANGNQLGNGYVAKFTDTGTGAAFGWAKQCGSLDFGRLTALSVNGTNVYVTGYFYSSTAPFDAITLTNMAPFSIYREPRCDAFVAKLTDAGPSASFVWAQQVRGMGHDRILAMAVSGPSVYVAGYYGSNFTSAQGPENPPVSLGTISIANTGYYDAFVAKITDAGASSSFAWAQRAGGTGMDSATAVTVRGNSVYVAGAYNSGQADFGATTLSNAAGTTGYFLRDIFLTKLVDAGATSSFAWAQQAGGAGGDYATSMGLAGTSIVVAGAVGPSASFSTQAINTASNQSTNNQVGFLAFLLDPTLLATAAAQGSLRFSLAPNPARTAATVQLPAVPGAPTATLTLTDALGRTLRTETLPLPAAGLRHELALNGLAPGFYVLHVRAGDATATRQLAVE